jgi:hypothetical protein
MTGQNPPEDPTVSFRIWKESIDSRVSAAETNFSGLSAKLENLKTGVLIRATLISVFVSLIICTVILMSGFDFRGLVTALNLN